MIARISRFWLPLPCAHLRIVTLVGACLAGASFSVADELTPALTVLRSADDAAADSAAIARAWRQAVQAPGGQLPTVLAALDGAGPLAANWLRSAVDAIVERELHARRALPQAELERFALDLKHQPRARRAAYEVVCLADPQAPARLLPGFLHDPSVELRRDAVAQVLAQAKQQLEAKQTDAARAAFQQALSGAVDLDQVNQIEQRLKELGDAIDVARHFGYVMHWKLIGPFDNVDEKGYAVAYPPEGELNDAAKYAGKEDEVAWVEHVTADRLGMVDLNKALGKHMGAAGYAWATFDSPQARPIELRMGCVCANKLWLNGQLLAANEVYHSGEEFDQYAAAGTLRAGANTILVKVCQNEMKETWAQDWRFQLRVCDATGTAVLAANRVDPPKSPDAAQPAAGGN